MSSRVLSLLLFVALLFDSAHGVCPANWTVLNRDCCSSTFGFHSLAPTFDVAQGAELPMNFIVWNDTSHSSLGIATNWATLSILWGKRTENEPSLYAVKGLIDTIRIYHQPGQGVYGLQFHDSSGFSPVLGLATSIYVDLDYGGRPFSGWGVNTHQSTLLNSLAACFRML